MRWPRTREIWIAALFLTAVLVWAGRFFVNPDGISYLDLSDDVQAGRLYAAVNGHWSPAYPYLLAVWLAPLGPGSRWEPVAVHLLNGILFIAALATFEFFLRALRKAQPDTEWLALPLASRSGKFCAYAVFLWCALVLITVRGVTPDMLLAAMGFGIAGLFTRIQSGAATARSHMIFGFLLGLAALTKQFMFPVALLVLGVSLVASARAGRAARLHLLSAGIFALVAAPQLIALSIKSARPTFGDSTRIVYALKVNQIPKLGAGPPVMTLSQSPRAIGFPTDMPNRTYPLWDEPSYWLSAARARYDVTDQAAALKRNLLVIGGIALKILIPLVLVLAFRDSNLGQSNRMLAAVSGLVLFGYAMLHSEARLIGFWLALLTLSLLAGITLDHRGTRYRLGRALVQVITVISLISTITYVFAQSFSSRPDRGLSARDLHLKVARTLQSTGVNRGSRVALLGDESDIYWARLAGVQIAAQIPLRDAPAYWTLSDAEKLTLGQRLAGTGAAALIASWTDPPAGVAGWIKVEGTRFSILPLGR